MIEHIRIRKADINDMDKIADLISSINEKKTKITKYDDFNFKHSKDSLKEVLSGKNKNEILFIAICKENFLGMINISFNNPDYIFFIDKFAYIKYMYVDKNKLIDKQKYEYVAKELFEVAISEGKKYGFKYICGDVLTEEDELKELFEMNDMKNYKRRMQKKVSIV
ncbi:GNAT family N-acetyltransferase [Clostridium tepidum]|jgi:hypothetical protein|uniref:N-acetyltransferase n=1 Tax=Clostridium tepidum TaxID=1962263 RepID=A0A1S9IHM6_9CLOT|nr:N-acetyltransferase [Clostridium tepidum]MCR1934568.1 N-acetyltransferase [Clostridium tepidum]MDU6877601.1 N-acetyltransferase [Clostridium botulinum]OOO62553.1 N-acetyltransferase [Clostridium tepidum]OOO69831.1 N-acetyltransferase [Clostridium tepidum]